MTNNRCVASLLAMTNNGGVASLLAMTQGHPKAFPLRGRWTRNKVERPDEVSAEGGDSVTGQTAENPH